MTPEEFRLAAGAFAVVVGGALVLAGLVKQFMGDGDSDLPGGCMSIYGLVVMAVLYLACEAVLQVAMALLR